MKKLVRLKNRGDTIVEVMVVLAVLGLALSITYASANRSLQAIRAAQESSFATQLLDSQVEYLRTMSANVNTTDTNYIFTSNTFCINQSGNVVQDTDATHTTYVAACNVDSGNGIPYAVSIVYDGSNTAEDTFTAKVSWDNVRGIGTDSVTLRYRVHKGQVSYLRADTDGDGVVDGDDQCPHAAGLPSNNGCPAPPVQDNDPDHDGFLGAADSCPNIASTRYRGCPAIAFSDPSPSPHSTDCNRSTITITGEPNATFDFEMVGPTGVYLFEGNGETLNNTGTAVYANLRGFSSNGNYTYSISQSSGAANGSAANLVITKTSGAGTGACTP